MTVFASFWLFWACSVTLGDIRAAGSLLLTRSPCGGTEVSPSVLVGAGSQSILIVKNNKCPKYITGALEGVLWQWFVHMALVSLVSTTTHLTLSRGIVSELIISVHERSEPNYSVPASLNFPDTGV